MTIDPNALAGGVGVINAPITNNGIINSYKMTINGDVSGSGKIKIGKSLELNGTVSQQVAFQDGTGTLTLDNPSGLTGTIAPAGPGDKIVLAGYSLNSVTGYQYAGDNSGGVLTIHFSAASDVQLNFSGHFSTQSFTLSAGSQPLSNSPPSVVITEAGYVPPTDPPQTTTYTFTPQVSQNSYAWTDSTIWTPAAVPNSPDADVIIPTVTKNGSTFFATIGLGTNTAIHSLSLTNNTLQLGGASLSVGGDINLLSGSDLRIDTGAILTAASLSNGRDLTGSASQITISGTLSNTGNISGSSGLVITAQQLNNTGTIEGGVGGLTVNVTGSGFAGTLTGGTYRSGGDSGSFNSTLRLNFGGVIINDAANIVIHGSEILSFDPGSSSYVPIESTLSLIDASGSLLLGNKAYDWTALTDNGLITVRDQGILNTPQLTVIGDLSLFDGTVATSHLVIASGGRVEGGGTINGSVDNSGVIIAEVQTASLQSVGLITINGAVSGAGKLEIAAAITSPFDPHGTQKLGAALELNGPVSQDVVFDGNIGTLTLDDPTHFTGSIKPIAGDRIILAGIGLSSITSYSYTGDAHGGILTLQESGGGHLDLKFTGVFDASNFNLAAGPQDLSTSPPSLLITVTAPSYPSNPGNVDEWILKDGDGHWAASAAPGSHPAGYDVAAVADFTGDGFSDILWQNVTTGAVDLWKMQNAAWAGSVAIGTHPAGYQIAGAGDFNHDGTSDVLWFNPTTGDTDIWELSNGQWAASVTAGAHPGGYQLAGVGDFNRDGTSDVLWFNPTTGDVDEWNIANGHWAGSNNIGNHPGGGWQVAGTGDFNHDGTSDVFWYNATTGQTDIWELANGHWMASVSPGNHPTGWQVAGIGDFNGDGTSDVLWFNPATRATEEWLIANGQWTASIAVGTHPGGATIAGIGDFTGGPTPTSDILWHQFV